MGKRPSECRSPFRRRFHDLRHAAVSPRLDSRLSATEVARRTGPAVAVLLKIYAHCIDRQADAANRRITSAPATRDTEQDPIDKGDGDIEPQPEMPGQRTEAGRTVSVTAPTGPVRGFCAPVRGLHGPGTRFARTHSGRRRPGIAPRSTYALVSGVRLG